MPIVSSQRTSAGLYTVDDVIRSPDQYQITGNIMSAYPKPNIAIPIDSDHRKDNWNGLYQYTTIIKH
jgi:hypothetical protein